MAGLLMFLGVLLVISQVLLHLFATSIVTAAAFDAANRVAADGRDCGHDGGVARDLVRERLGRYGDQAEVTCSDDGVTVVTVSVPSPARRLSAVTFGLPLDRVERTAVVRTEGGGST